MQPVCAPGPHFVRIAPGFARAADVADGRVFDETDFVTTLSQSKAKVSLFAIKKKFGIKSAQLRKNLAADYHACADNPRNLAGKAGEIFSNMRLVRISGRWLPQFSCGGQDSAASHAPGFVLRKGAAKRGQSSGADELCVWIQVVNKTSVA